ncbi:hypothetical protein RKE30_34820 [Streptomyces sp. Li-HN-5-11]|uniref:hypothetical protein n=1 Tax=Streptomyces sp. Li-HN-5-11 TaxID=3075432 RepID=UPI0028B08B17|nr:hypothetical protein [Streptomyces sp. Li-HN-5-11]WNM35173.1 hypothetical protein RKE30_34820 [Streptomyces sp. Li-HN-5-11]
MRLPRKGDSLIPQRIVLASAAGLASALLLGACGSSNNNASSTSPGSAAPAASNSATSAPAASAPAGSGHSRKHGSRTTMVTAKAISGLGSVVTDDKGRTLYRYGKDQASPSKWTCAGACTMTWIPVIVGDSVRTSGVAQSLLGTVHRNGRKQLTLAGWPLYRYVGDAHAGQANGQGKDKEWYAVAPSGRKATPKG